MPEFLYHTEDEGERARQWRDRERECVRDRPLLEERDSVDNKIRLLERTCDVNVRLISEVIKMLLMMLYPRFASFLC